MFFRGSSSSSASKDSAPSTSSQGAASLKWISAKQTPRGPVLSVDPLVSSGIFDPLGKSLVGLISIFGAARQGKSFLMNCLAGETDLFRISNERESCTQGIDVSRKLMDLSAFAGDKKSGYPNLKVGFVDAEGQGDKDMGYDANLVCPILLASKCVIFNWKDSMQKDRILQLLGVMHRAAINVADEGDIDVDGGGDQSKVFGHLHVVFRDWQYVDSTPESVKNDVFKEERSADQDARLRNAIRNDVKGSFKSITVWLFPSPSATSQALSTKLKVETTSEAFKTQLKALKACLATQLSEPMMFAGKPFTGKTIGPLVGQIVEALNSGEAVRPMSAYTNMLRCEVDKSRLEAEALLREVASKHLAALPRAFSEESLPSCEAVTSAYLADVAMVVATFSESTKDTIASLSMDLAQQVSKDAETSIAHMRQTGLDQINALLKSHCGDWIGKRRAAIERDIDEAFNRIEKDDLPMSAEALSAYTASMFGELSTPFRSAHVDATSKAGVADALAQLKKYFDMRCEICTKNNALLEKSASTKSATLLEASSQVMRTYIADRSKVYYTQRGGFALQSFIGDLNSKYGEVEAQLKTDLAKAFKRENHPTAAKLVEEFRVVCGGLGKQIREVYGVKLTEAFTAEAEAGYAELAATVANISDVDVLFGTADALLKSTFEKTRHNLQGWTSSGEDEKALLRQLQGSFEQLIDQREKQLAIDKASSDRQAARAAEELAQESMRKAAKAKTTPASVKKQPKQAIVEEEEEEDDTPMDVSVSVAPSSRASLSVTEQRARAKAWAEEEASKAKGSARKSVANTKSKGKQSDDKKLDSVEEAIEAARREQEERMEAAARTLMDTSNVASSKKRKSVKNVR